MEIRVCDVCPDPDDAVAIALLCRALVETAAADEAARPVPVELLRAAGWRAARYGMSGALADLRGGASAPAWELADAFVGYVEDALVATGDVDLVRGALGRIRSRGTGADVQRAAFGAGGVAAAVDAVTLRPS